MLHRKFKFTEDHDVKEIVVRRINGYDERDAAKQLDAMNGASTLFNELVRISIVSVDGEEVMQPFMTYDTWPTRTRELVMTAFNTLNENSDAEKAAFLAASEDVAPLVTRSTPRRREEVSTQPTTE